MKKIPIYLLSLLLYIIAYNRFFEPSVKNVLICLGIYLLTAVFVSVTHELGHLIGGLVSGYRLICLQLGSLLIYSESGRLHMRTDSGHSCTQCVMYPHGTRGYLMYNLGGLAANVIILIAAIVLMLLDVGGFIAYSAGICSVLILIINTMTGKKGSMPNDYMICKMIKKEGLLDSYIFYLETVRYLSYESDEKKISGYISENREILDKNDFFISAARKLLYASDGSSL